MDVLHKAWKCCWQDPEDGKLSAYCFFSPASPALNIGRMPSDYEIMLLYQPDLVPMTALHCPSRVL
jgi:hypothetical protein